MSKERQTLAGSDETSVQASANAYDPQFAVTVKQLVDLGFNDDDICCALGVESETLSRWKRDHLEFATALSRTNEQITSLVEAKLLEKAVGYEREHKKVLAVGPSRVPLTVRIVEQVPPEFDALRFVLTNLASAKWHRAPAMPPPPAEDTAEQIERAYRLDKFRRFLMENAEAGGPPVLSDEDEDELSIGT